MSAAATQQEGKTFRGIDSQWLYPFGTAGKIQGDDTPLGAPISGLGQYNATHNYYKSNDLDIPVGTSSFLCYCSAYQGGYNDFTGGAIHPTWPTVEPETTTASAISFSPKKIQENATSADVKATAIANYMTALAKAIPEGNKNLFNQFINYGHIIPASSSYVEGLKSWLTTESITLPTTTEDISGYPANINLPDGAAVVQWNNSAGDDSKGAFEPVLQTTTQANINSLNRFVYPAALWYYANSRIKTSTSNQFDNYSQSWDEVLALHENDNAVVSGGEVSIAVKEPLQYAVGCLELELDAATTIAQRENYQLTGVFISSQFPQKFDFTPNVSVTGECIIYDKTIEDGFTMASTDKKNYTLVFQTPDSKDVRIALEFQNNSGANFNGIETMDLDGHQLKSTIYNGTKFYLVGTIKLQSPTTDDYTKRVFTKHYITHATVKIKDLSQAHPYLPDLLDPRLEVGIVVEPKWIPADPTNVPL